MSQSNPRRGQSVSASSHSEHGSILIEAMVAMLIFLIGILGLIGVQGAMTREQSESKVRAEAAFLANDVVGRMWGDLTHVASYGGSGCATWPACQEWQNKVSRALPGGLGTVSFDSATGDIQITITWQLATGQPHKYVTSTTIVKAGG